MLGGIIAFLLLLVIGGTLFGTTFQFIADPSTMIIIYLSIAFFGGFLMLLEFFSGILSGIGDFMEGALGGIFESLDFLDSIPGVESGGFSFKGMGGWAAAFFMLGYGGLGSFLTGIGIHPVSTAFISALMPALFIVIIFEVFFSRFSESSTAIKASDLIGRTATVSISIDHPGDIGQITLNDPGAGNILKRATADRPIKVGEKVSIIDCPGGLCKVK